MRKWLNSIEKITICYTLTLFSQRILWKTLANAVDISKTTSRTFNKGLAFKRSKGTMSCWNKLINTRNVCFKAILSTVNLWNIQVTKMQGNSYWRIFIVSLYTRTTLHFFQLFGKVLNFKQLSNIMRGDCMINERLTFNIRTGTT